MTRILGVDPGLTGAVALWDDSLDALEVRDAPTVEIKVGRSKNRTVYLKSAYKDIIKTLEPDLAIVEEVNGIKGQSASASFNFGRGLGLLEGILIAFDVPIHPVSPIAWQRALRVPAGKDGSRLRATQLYPAYSHLFSLKKHHGRAEAALIARYPV